jgi:chaperonin GroES
MIKVRPLGDRILVKRLEEEEVMKGGIIIPDTAKEKPQRGEVIAVGLGRLDEEGKRLPLDVQVSDTILFGKYAGSEVTIDDDEYLIMREEDVLAVIEEGKSGTKAGQKKSSK